MGTSSKPRVAAAGLLLFFAALMLYGWTAAGGIVAGDGPELTVAAYRLGIPHPSGYPTYTLLGRLFTLFPFGSVAFRMNLFAAVAGAGAVGLLGAWLFRVTRSPASSALAAGALATSLTLWRESTSAEVYSLTAFFLALLLFVLPERRDPRRVLLSAYLWGLALTNHLALAFLLPAFVMHGLRVGRPDRRTMAGAVLLFGFGLTAYAYLPVRASLSPPWNWGDPSTLDRFLFHVLGRGYWGYLGEGGSFGRLLAWVGGLGRELTGAAWIAVPAGLWFLRRERRDLLLLVAGGALLSLGYTLHFQINDPDAYFMPVHLLLTVPFAFGIRAAIGRNRTAAVAACAALVLVQACGSIPRAPLSEGSVLEEYVDNLLLSVGDGKGDPVVVAEGDAETFGLLYMAESGEGGTGVSLWNPLLDVAREGPALERLGRGVRKTPGWRRQAIRYGVESGTPVYAVVESDEIRADGYRLVPWGLVYRYAPIGAPPPDGGLELWSEYRTGRARRVNDDSGYLDRILAATYPIQEGRGALLLGDRERAFGLFEEGARIGTGLGPVLNNVGLAYEKAGDRERAREAYLRAEEASSDGLPSLNLARLSAAEGRTEEAEERFRRVANEDPRLRFAASLEWAEMLVRAGRAEEAEVRFRDAGVDRPWESSPPFGIGRCEVARGDFQGARESFRHADRLRPGLGSLGEYMIADELRRRNRVDEAARVYESLAGDPPTDREALRSLALLRSGRGEERAADSIFALARSLDGGDPETMNAEAWMLAESGRDRARALELIREARRIDGENPSYADTEGWVLYGAGDFAGAAASFEEAVRLGMEGAGVRYRLGLSLALSGRIEEGRAFLEAALDFDPESPHAAEARRLLRSANEPPR
ncbi:MAG: DUF2723 domain-containing protein [Candidatus Eisenbacteria bacterium]